jgi:dynein heavy chain
MAIADTPLPSTPLLLLLFQVIKFLVDDSEVGEWTLQGLPTDELSIQNGIMVTRASRYPVLVDPQGQGRIWIMNREEANQLKVTQLNDRMFRNHLEDCLSFGKPLLIENIEEELDPILDAVLERRLIKKGKSYVVPLADKEVDFTDTFRLFCTTRLPNPHFTPELSAKVCLECWRSFPCCSLACCIFYNNQNVVHYIFILTKKSNAC